MNGWDIAVGLTNLVARLPIERLFTRNSTKDLEAFEQRLRERGLLAGGTNPSAGGHNPAKIAPQGVSATSAHFGGQHSSAKHAMTRSDLDPGTLAYQEDMALGEAYLLEDHLKRLCIGCGDDLDCCWKTSDKLSRYAHETMSMTTDPFWKNLINLAEEIKVKSHPDDVEAGTYAAEYLDYAIRVSEFRRPLQRKAIERARKPMTLEGGKKIAAEEAAERVEQQWPLVQEPPDADLPGDTVRQQAQELANRVRAGELSRSGAVAMLADDLAKRTK